MLEAAESPTQNLANQMNEGAVTRSRRLEKELALSQQQLREQMDAAEMLIRQLATERDESRTQLSEVEDSNRKLREELAVAQEQYLQLRGSAVKAIRKMAWSGTKAKLS